MSASETLPAKGKGKGDWVDVMAGLTGVRLAIYDELIRGGIVGAETLAALTRDAGSLVDFEAAVQWLAEHHFIEPARDGSGAWQPVGRGLAEERFNRGVVAAAPSAKLNTIEGQRPARAPADMATTAPVSPVHHQTTSWDF